MECKNCHANLAITARFCPSCGTQNVQSEDAKSPQEVSVEWLKTILENLEYKVEPLSSSTSLLAKHETNPNLAFDIRREAEIITVQSLWNIPPPKWLQKNDFLVALNKANSVNWFCTCYSSESLDSLNISSFIFLSERLSSRDITVFIEMFASGVLDVLNRSGIRKFA
jgi:hypothetical protein